MFEKRGNHRSVAYAATQPIRITADLTDAPRRLCQAEVDIPVHAGPVALTTPQWIPGDHRPTGPVEDIVGVVFTANGKTLPWTCDETDLYQFHVEVPAGVTSLHAHLDCIVTTRVSDHIAVLEWERLLLYPANTPVREIAIQPSLTVPAQSSKEPIHLLIQSEEYIRPVDIDYHDGERYPALVRADGTKDYLDEITMPLGKPQPQPAR
jgi:hypothetical protein